MPGPLTRTDWWQITPLQRALLKRIACEGALERLEPWQGRTARSLVARDLLDHRYRERRRARVWLLTPQGTDVLQRAMSPIRSKQDYDRL